MGNLKIENIDVVVVGAGPSGAIIARRYAEEGKKVLVLDKRDHIAGNLYDLKNENNITYHKYGPHIFHTNDDQVIEYVKKFTDFIEYRWKVNVNIAGKEVPLPINFESIDLLFEKQKAEEIKKELKKEFKEQTKTFIMDMLEIKNKTLNEFANFVYKNVFENYTTKMWGILPSQIDRSVLKRVPVRLNYDDGYFDDKFQGIPKNGYTAMANNILSHENIKIQLNTNAMNHFDLKDQKIYCDGNIFNKILVWTGPLEELFKEKFGKLDYRSLDFKFETHNKDQFQTRGTVNYPSDSKMTRITEYKKVTGEKNPDWTIISKEYPGKYNPETKFNERYYPISTEENNKKYNEYFEESNKYKNLLIIGRLAEYKYKDMWVAIKDALNKNLKNI